jgi:2-methylaconitate cis-trans-isomerase PrpF
MGIMGSPDPVYKRQLNGMGGGVSSLSKAVVVSPSDKPDIDCEYTFIQVGIGEEEGLDLSGNCGNLSSMVGVYAVDSGICKPQMEGEMGRVRCWNTNTNKVIDTSFPLDDSGRPNLGLEEVELAGVPAKASRIFLEFVNPAGARTGKLLPTGNTVDVLNLPDDDLVEVSLVDATNPTVILPQHELRILLSLPAISDPTNQIDYNAEGTLKMLDAVRVAGAKAMGLEPALAQPKIVVVQPPSSKDSEEDLVVHALSMGVYHKAIPMTVGLCVGVAAKIKNTVVERMLRTRSKGQHSDASRGVKLRHPGGIVEVGANLRPDGSVQSASVVRTGRRLMQGSVYW